jgi:hypothetical protein
MPVFVSRVDARRTAAVSGFCESLEAEVEVIGERHECREERHRNEALEMV